MKWQDALKTLTLGFQYVMSGIIYMNNGTHPIGLYSGYRRWITLGATVCIQCCLGSAYTWSLFNAAFARKLNSTVSQVAFTFALLCLFLSFSSPVSGRIQDYIGTRYTAVFSSILLGGSYALASIVPQLSLLYIVAGVMLGCAEGMGYLPTLSNCIRWFPEWKGVMSSIVVGSYGLGSLGFKYINFYLLSHYGLETTFLMLGGGISICIIGCSMGVFDAPYRKPLSSKVLLASKSIENNFTVIQCMRCMLFWLLVCIFFITCVGGVYILGTVNDLGQSLAGLSARAAADSVAIIAVANIAGRLVMGTLSDRITRIKVITAGQCLAIIGLGLLVFAPLDRGIFYLAVACIIFNFGGTLSVYPSLIGDYFGLNNLSKNYGFIYLGFGIGGLVGLIVSSLLNSFMESLIMTLCFEGLALGMSMITKNSFCPRKETGNEKRV